MASARSASLLPAVLIVAGCSTPQPALDLAAQGALVVDQAQAEAQGFVDRATRTYRAREGIVRDLARGDIEDASRTELRSWLARQADLPSDAARVEKIKRIAEQSRTSREKREADLAAKATAIGATFGDAVTVPAEKLSTAKKAFASLAQELTAEEWLKFSWKYAKDLRDDIKALKAPTPASAPASGAAP